MSAGDQWALYNQSTIKLEEIIESIKNWTYSCEASALIFHSSNLETCITPLARNTRIKGGRLRSPVTGAQATTTRYAYATSTKPRSLLIPSLKDILLQTAIKLLVESLCEEKIFNKQSFGFRPNRSAHHALKSAKEGMEGVT